MPLQVTPLLMLDRYALFYIGLILAASMAFVLLSYGYFDRCEGDHDELYILMLVATLGSTGPGDQQPFCLAIPGLEMLSVPLYGMIAYRRHQAARPRSRHQVPGAGCGFRRLPAFRNGAYLRRSRHHAIWRNCRPAGACGLRPLARSAGLRPDRHWLRLQAGGGSLSPLDARRVPGAPAPVTAYIATVSKGAMFALLLRFFYRSGAHDLAPVFIVFSIIAIASMIAGNVLALLQNNVKRILAYSSIAHLGYMLVAFQAAGDLGSTAVTFYLVAYFMTTMGAFGVVTVLSDGSREAEDLEDYRGLFWRRPVLAAVFTAMLLSLAGIPVTAGFIGKFYIVAAGASSAMWALIIILVITSAIGLFYYLRIIVVMYGPAGRKPDRRVQARSGRRPGPCTFGRSLSVVWRVPGAIAEYHSKRASRVGLKGQTMFPLKKILLPIDFSERCLGGARYAIPLVEHFHSELTLLHVISPMDYLSPEVQTFNEDHRKRAAKELADFLCAALNHSTLDEYSVRAILRRSSRTRHSKTDRT